MVTIKENIRFYKANDPYYYEVDNLPLIDLLNNDKILRDEINTILTSTSNYITEATATTIVQNAIGTSTEVDIDGDGVTPVNNIIAWINSKNYLSADNTNLGDLKNVDTSSNAPANGNSLIYDANTSKWVPGGSERQGIQYLPQRYFIIGQEKTNINHPDSFDQKIIDATDRNQAGYIAQQKNNGLYRAPGTQADVFCLDSYQGYNFEGPDDNHRTFTFHRRFSDIGLPPNAKRIYGVFGLRLYADAASTVNEDTWQIFSHPHSLEQPTRIGAYGDDSGLDNRWSTSHDIGHKTILYMRSEKFSGAFNYMYHKDFCVEYQLPRRNMSSGDGATYSENDYATNTPDCTLENEVLSLSLAFYNKTYVCDLTIYIWGYEAWD